MKKMLFDKTKEGEDLYREICDSPKVNNINQKCEELWLIFKPYADNGFEQEFRRAVVSRFWEMYLGALLLKQNKNLIPKEQKKNKDYGPDFCIIENDGKKIWIEATAPSKGNEKTDEEIILKIRSRIKEKYNGDNREKGKYLKYRDDLIIKESEPYIIAINGSNLDSKDSPLPIEQPNIFKAVFAVGDSSVDLISPNKLKFETRKEIETKKGSPVETDIFLNEKYAGISAIIYSEIKPHYLEGCPNPYTALERNPYNSDYINQLDPVLRYYVLDHSTRYIDGFGLYFLVVYNPNAKNPLNRDWLENKGT